MVRFQYDTCPPLLAMHSSSRLGTLAVSVLIPSSGTASQIASSRLPSRFKFVGGSGYSPRRRCIMSQTCSMGERAGDRTGQGSRGIALASMAF